MLCHTYDTIYLTRVSAGQGKLTAEMLAHERSMLLRCTTVGKCPLDIWCNKDSYMFLYTPIYATLHIPKFILEDEEIGAYKEEKY